jgi:hypothetical protein
MSAADGDKNKHKGFLRRAFGHAAGVLGATLKLGIGLSVTGLAASVAISAAALRWGDDTVSEPIAAYMQRKDLPKELLSGIRNTDIRVYRHSLLTPFHTAGISGLQIAGDVWNDPDAGLLDKISAGFTALPGYVNALDEGLRDYKDNDPYDAYTLPPAAEGMACYIRPPGDSSVFAAAAALSGLPEENMRPLPGAPNGGHRAIMAHEIVHCDHDDYDPFASAQLESEIDADIAGVSKVADVEGSDDILVILKYARAVGAFSQPDAFDADHATALMMDAAQRGAALPSREDVFYANSQLNEMLQKRLEDYDPDKAGAPYYIAAYKEMRKIVGERTPTTAPLVVRAAQLYIEGVDYLTEGASAPQPQKPKPRAPGQPQKRGPR